MNIPDRQSGSGLKKHLGGTVLLILQPLALNAISLWVLGYIIRSLGASGYGSWYTASTLTATVTFITNLGLRMHFIRQVASDHEVAETALAEQLGMRLLLSVLAACIAVIACSILRYPPMVLACTAITGVALVIATIGTTLVDLLQATLRLKSVASNNFVSGLALTAASFVAIKMGTGVVGVALSYLIGPIVNVALGIYVVRKEICPIHVRFELRRCWEIVKESHVLGVQVITFAIGNQIDSLLTPKLVGIAQNGFYGAGILLPSRLGVIPDALSTTFYPILSRKYTEGLRVALRASYIYIGLSLLSCLPIAAFVSFLAHFISEILFPNKPAICTQIMMITIWALPIGATTLAMGYTLNACRREKVEATCSLIANACGIAVSFILISRYGLVGACWSLVSRSALAAIIRVPPYLMLVASGRNAPKEPAPAPEPDPPTDTVTDPSAIDAVVGAAGQK